MRVAAIEESGHPELSKTDVLSAHLSRMCTQLMGYSEGTPFGQAIVMDIRGRVPGLPNDFVGNAAYVVGSADFLVGESLAHIASKNHDALTDYLQRPSERLVEVLQLGEDLIVQKALWLPFEMAAHFKKPEAAYINSFTKFPIYEVDFGVDDKPIKPVCVIPHNLQDPILIWPAPPEVGGIEIYFTGSFARALQKQGDDWWRQMLQFEDIEK